MFEITRNLVSWDIEPLFYVFLQKGSNRRFPGVVVLRNNIAAFVSQTCSPILPQQSSLRFRQGEDVPPFRLYNCVGPASKPQGFCCRHVLLIPLFDSAEQSEPLKMTSEQWTASFFPFSVHVIPHIFVWGSCFWLRTPVRTASSRRPTHTQLTTHNSLALDKKWIIEVIRWELNPLTCN